MGMLNFMFPLWQDDDDLIFVDLRGQDSDGPALEGNAGLAYRRIMGENKDWILGYYGFVDYLQSVKHNHFTQGVLGMEVLNEDWDFRANGYYPERDSPLVSRSITSLTPVINGNSIRITEHVSEVREKALPGFDAEVGTRLPWDTTQLIPNSDLWLYGAYFYFDDSDAPQIAGPRFRWQWNVDDIFKLEGTRLQLEGEIQHDKVRHWEYFGGVSVRIPLGNSSATKPTTSLRPIEKRMLIPIVRDVDIITTDKTPAQIDQSVPAVNPNTNEIIRAIHYAEEGGAGNGTASSPESLVNAVTNAGTNGMVVATAGGGNYANTNQTLLAGQILAGAGSNVQIATPGGMITTLPLSGTTPTLDGGGAGDVITLADDNTVQGLTIQNAGDDGIQATNANNFSILNNTISSNGGAAIEVIQSDGGSRSSFDITGNVMSGNDYGVYAYIHTGSTASDFVISGNTVTSTTRYPVEIWSNSATLSQFTISGNTMPNAGGGDNIYLYFNGASTISDFTISNNILNGSNFSNLDIEILNTSTASGFTISGNTMSSGGRNGITLYSYNSASFSDFTISNNVFNGTDRSNLHMLIINTSTVSGFTISGNTMTGGGRSGIAMYSYDSASFSDFTVTGNSITNETQSGVYLYREGTSTFTDINFGDASTGLGGFNSIFDNTGLDFKNDSNNNSIKAENNFWTGGGACGAECGGANTTDTDPFLTSNPN